MDAPQKAYERCNCPGSAAVIGNLTGTFDPIWQSARRQYLASCLCECNLRHVYTMASVFRVKKEMVTLGSHPCGWLLLLESLWFPHQQPSAVKTGTPGKSHGQHAISLWATFWKRYANEQAAVPKQTQPTHMHRCEPSLKLRFNRGFLTSPLPHLLQPQGWMNLKRNTINCVFISARSSALEPEVTGQVCILIPIQYWRVQNLKPLVKWQCWLISFTTVHMIYTVVSSPIPVLSSEDLISRAFGRDNNPWEMTSM